MPVPLHVSLRILAVALIFVSFHARAAEAPSEAERGSDFDFDLFGDSAPQSPEPFASSSAESAELRRAMLQAHPIAGLTTLGLMATTVVLGQLNFNDHFGTSGAGSGAYSTPHRVAAYSTAGALVVTAGLGILAPVPYEKRGGFDAGTVHKISAYGATAGMVGQVVLGVFASQALQSGDAKRLGELADAHQILGYATLGLLTTAALSWVF